MLRSLVLYSTDPQSARKSICVGYTAYKWSELLRSSSVTQHLRNLLIFQMTVNSSNKKSGIIGLRPVY